MDDKFTISYIIDSIDRDALRFEPDQLSFQLHAIEGRAVVSMGEKTIDVPSCALLFLTHNLTYLAVMPLLYRTEEWEANIDHGLDMSSWMVGDRLRLRFRGLPTPPPVNFDVPPLEALAEIGRVGGELVKAYYDAVGDKRKFGRISALLPFASVKLMPQ